VAKAYQRTRGASSDAQQPLYEQVYDELAARIATDWRPGSRLPSERALCEALGVSRLTLQRALTLLRSNGLVERGDGRGWRTADTAVSEAPNELVGFSELAFGKGLTPSSVVLVAQARESTLAEAELLRIAPGAQLFDLERLRLLDGVAVAVDRAQLPLMRAPFLPEVDFATASLDRALGEHGVWPTTANYTVEVWDADARLAELLEVPVGKGLLCASGTTFDQDKVPIQIGWIAYRPDRYRLQTRLVRRRRPVHRAGPS
jgi:GntR family transcriptional regulator